jgi:hypothetical protein
VDEPILALARRDFQLLERNHDVFLGDAKEPADADDRGRDVAVAVANLVFGRIINIRLIDVGGEPMARRKFGEGARGK